MAVLAAIIGASLFLENNNLVFFEHTYGLRMNDNLGYPLAGNADSFPLYQLVRLTIHDFNTNCLAFNRTILFSTCFKNGVHDIAFKLAYALTISDSMNQLNRDSTSLCSL